jgi:hypothetical protein
VRDPGDDTSESFHGPGNFGASSRSAFGTGEYPRQVVVNSESATTPDAFRRAVQELAAASWRPELLVEEIPAPQRIAPFSAAVTADVLVGGEEAGSGRLVLLHDPAGNSAWQGTFRCVTFARADVDPEMVTDPLLASVGWSWLIDALEAHHADHLAPSGTVNLGLQRVVRGHVRGAATRRGGGARVLDAGAHRRRRAERASRGLG